MKALNSISLSLLTKILSRGLLLFVFLFIALSVRSSGQVEVKKLRTYKFSVGAEFRSFDHAYKFLGGETSATPGTLISSERQMKQSSQDAKGFFIRLEKRNPVRGLVPGIEFTLMRGEGFPLAAFDNFDGNTTDGNREVLAYQLEIGDAYELSLILKMARSEGIKLFAYPYIKAGFAVLKAKETLYAAGTTGSAFSTGKTVDLSKRDFNSTDDPTSLKETHLSIRKPYQSSLEGLKIALGGELKLTRDDGGMAFLGNARLSMFAEYFFITYSDGKVNEVNKFEGRLKRLKQNGIAFGLSVFF